MGENHLNSLFSLYPIRYDSFGRLTNITFPTGHISSFRTDTDSSVKVQVESSNKEDVTITTNLSASGAFYTLLQGEFISLQLIPRMIKQKHFVIRVSDSNFNLYGLKCTFLWNPLTFLSLISINTNHLLGFICELCHLEGKRQ